MINRVCLEIGEANREIERFSERRCSSTSTIASQFWDTFSVGFVFILHYVGTVRMPAP